MTAEFPLTLSPTLVPEQTCCSLLSAPLTENQAQTYAAYFKVLSDPARLQIVSIIAAQGCSPITVGELVDKMHIGQPTVSHHLKKLAEVGLIERQQQGRSAYYTVQIEAFRRLCAVLGYSA
ncbi:ArsR/SmtB family transcription factor [Rothia nasimurium]|uniref:ArsR/SmtB family transcription factor n=1 Tax=Rothia nasimurium TaxID=85336 RepID=UPI003BA08DB2